MIAGWSRERAVRQAGEVLSSLGMGKKLKSLPRQLSGGQMQRVAIAGPWCTSRASRLRRADSRADHETGITVMELLREAAVRPDRAVVVVTHDNRVFSFGDRIAHMDDGAIVVVDEKVERDAANGRASLVTLVSSN